MCFGSVWLTPSVFWDTLTLSLRGRKAIKTHTTSASALAVEAFAQVCSPAIQESHVRISTRDRRDCYDQLSRIETAESVNPWALYGLAVAKARAHRIHECTVDALGAICGVAPIDDRILEVMLDPERDRDPEDEYWNSNRYISTRSFLLTFRHDGLYYVPGKTY
jgi:hypothetical protein